MNFHTRNKISRRSILTIDEIVFVSVDKYGNPKPHGKTAIRYDEDDQPRSESNSDSSRT